MVVFWCKEKTIFLNYFKSIFFSFCKWKLLENLSFHISAFIQRLASWESTSQSNKTNNDFYDGRKLEKGKFNFHSCQLVEKLSMRSCQCKKKVSLNVWIFLPLDECYFNPFPKLTIIISTINDEPKWSFL